MVYKAMSGKNYLAENANKKNPKETKTYKADILESLVRRKFLHLIFQR